MLGELVKAAVGLIVWMGVLGTVVVIGLMAGLAGIIFLIYEIWKESRW